MKKPLIERRISALEAEQGMKSPMTISVLADDPKKEVKIDAAREACGKRELLVIVKRIVSCADSKWR